MPDPGPRTTPAETTDPPDAPLQSPKHAKIKHTFGVDFMLRRKLNGDGTGYESCANTESGRSPESIVHRYNRMVGFKRLNQTAIDADATAATARSFGSHAAD